MSAWARLGAFVAAVALLMSFACARGAEQAQSGTGGASWTLERSRNGGWVMSRDGVPVVRCNPVGWGAGWAWALGGPSPWKVEGGAYRARIPMEKLQLALSLAWATAPSGADITIVPEMRAGLVGSPGVGFELVVDASAVPAGARGQKPALLSDGRGWRWDLGGGEVVEVLMEPPVMKAVLDRNDPFRPRLLLLAGDVAATSSATVMKVRGPAGLAGVVAPWERYDPAEPGSWAVSTVDWRSSPIDLSYLNHTPAGSRGRVRADGERLVYGDGGEARFWGTNLSGFSLFSGTKEDVQRQAKRLASLGFNLVRLHHHDSHWVNPNVFMRGESTQALNPQALDRIDWWVKCLRDEGIYVWIDMQVGRRFRAGDGVPGFAELGRQDGGSPKGFLFVNERIQELMLLFQHAYFNRVNAYTGLRYPEDPAVLAVLLTNESGLTWHFGNLMLADKNNPVHQKMFEERARRFARQAGLNEGAALRTWEPGVSQIVLNELEAQTFDRLTDDLRAMGFQGLVAPTSTWGGKPVYGLPSMLVGDVIDAHAYAEEEFLSVDMSRQSTFLNELASAQVAGRPMTVSEWGMEHPKVDRFVGTPVVAATAARQGWDAVLQYAYWQEGLGQAQQLRSWSIAWDPAQVSQMPAAALVYRLGLLSPASRTRTVKLTRAEVYEKNTSAVTDERLRPDLGSTRLRIGLPDLPMVAWDDGIEAAGASDDSAAGSGEDSLEFDWRAGVARMVSPRAVMATGWIGGAAQRLGGVVLELETKKASAWVVSLDDKPIAESSRVFITLAARAMGMPGNEASVRTEQVVGRIVLPGEQGRRPVARAIKPGGGLASAELAVEWTGEGWAVSIGRVGWSHWVMVER